MEYSPYSGLENTPFRYAAWKIAYITGFFFRVFQKSGAKQARSARHSQRLPLSQALALVAHVVFAFRGCPLKEASRVFSDIKRTAEERSYDWLHVRTLSIQARKGKNSITCLHILVGEL